MLWIYLVEDFSRKYKSSGKEPARSGSSNYSFFRLERGLARIKTGKPFSAKKSNLTAIKSMDFN